MRIGPVPSEYHHNTRDLEHDRVGRSRPRTQETPETRLASRAFASPLECFTAVAAEMTPLTSSQLNQTARDSRLSHPKHPPKFSVAIHGTNRLFGHAALLPLQSQARARARSEATMSARSTVGHIDSYGQRNKRTQLKGSRDRSTGLCGTPSSGAVAVRRTAWGDGGGGSVLQHARCVVKDRWTISRAATLLQNYSFRISWERFAKIGSMSYNRVYQLT